MKPLFNLAGWTIVLLVSFGFAGSVSAQTFELFATPSEQPLAQGESVQFGVRVVSSGGDFTNPVTLTCDLASLPAGVSCTFDPPSVTPGAQGGVSMVTVTTTAPTTPTGNHTLTFQGQFQSEVKVATAALIVGPAPDFAISLNPLAGTVTQGGSIVYTVTVATTTGYTESVDLVCSNLPTDASCTLNPAAVKPGGTSELTVITAGTTPVGAAILVVSGTSTGSFLPRAGVALLDVVSPSAVTYELIASPATQTVTPGGNTQYQVAVNSVNGTFSQAVSLSCVAGTLPAGAVCVFNPASVTPGAGGATSTMTVTTDTTTPEGTNNITIRGSSGSDRREDGVSLVVGAAQGFGIAISPSSATVTGGSAATYIVTVTPDAIGFSSPVTFACSDLPSGSNCTFNPSTVTPNGDEVTTTMTVSTTTITSFVAPGSGSPVSPMGIPLLPFAVPAVFLGFLAVRNGRGAPGLRRRLLILALVAVAIPVLLVACSDDDTTTTAPPPPPPAPTPVTTTFTVTATGGGLDRTDTATITVNP